MATGSDKMSAQLEFAITAARGEIHRLLSLFPTLQSEFTSTNHTAPAVPLKEIARSRTRDYHREYYRRHRRKKKKRTDNPGHSQFSAAGRKKLSDAMKSRWAQAKAAGTTLMQKGDFTAGLEHKNETPKDRKNRLQREWRANQKKNKKGVK